MSRHNPTPSAVAATRGGFTLIEILIVVIILGILAAIVIPQFSNATTQARESTLREDLRYLRTQINAFKYQHRETLPGYPGGDPTADPSADVMLDQMTKFSDEACRTSATASPAYPYGPYLTKMPPNPISGKAGVLVVTGDAMPAADESQSHGWIYNPTIVKVRPNLAGNDTAGQPYANY